MKEDKLENWKYLQSTGSYKNGPTDLKNNQKEYLRIKDRTTENKIEWLNGCI